MPALKNQRHERFCHLIKQGLSPYSAYPKAGYKQSTCSPYRLLEKDRIKRRIAELNRSIAMKTRVTVESVTEELDRIAAGAEKAEQYAAAKSAVETKAKLHGLLIERKETGAPGDFSGLQSADEVLDIVRKEFGEDTARALAAVLSKSQEVEPNVDGSDAVN